MQKMTPRRLARLQFAILATGLLPLARANANGPLFDNFGPVIDGTGPALPSDAAIYYTTPNSAHTPPDSVIADSAEGAAYVVPAGTTDLTGIDLVFANVTNTDSFNTSAYSFPQYNGGNGTTYSAFKIVVSIWGTVTPTKLLNTSNASLSSTNPAFSNLLSTQTFTFNNSGSSLPPSTGIYYFENNSAPGALPGLAFSSPVALNGATTIGVSYNLLGSTDGTTYSNVAGLTPIIGADIPPVTGSQQTDSFYINDAGETNGNYIEGPHYFADSSGTAIPNQGVLARVFGDGPGVTYNWTNPSGGVFTDATSYSPSGVVPSGNDTVVYNLSSSSPYAVELTALQSVGNMLIQNDNVALNLDSQTSQLYVQNLLAVGLSPTASGSIQGTLTIENTTRVQQVLAEAGNIVVGGNGGTGTLNVTALTYLLADASTTINAGSKLVVGPGGKFETTTLTFAGTTNAWAGQLDLGTSASVIETGTYSSVMNQLKTGYNNGHWTGQGIVSSAAAADSTHLTAIGAIVNNDGNGNVLYGSGTALGQFDSEDPPLNAVLLRYTYYGDANLDGQVDSTDYAKTDNGFLGHLTGWSNGDFNYDGVVNGSDYTLIDNAFNMQANNIVTGGGYFPDSITASLREHPIMSQTPTLQQSDILASAASTAVDPVASVTTEFASSTAVPEPTSLGLLAAGIVPLLSRRRCKNQSC